MTRLPFSRALSTCAVLILLITCTAGCTVNVSAPTITMSDLPCTPGQTTPSPTASPTLEETCTPTPTVIETPPAVNGTIRIGAFNIQVFGTTKAGKPEVMDVLARIIRTYDIVAVQEVRDSSGTALPALLEAVNADGSDYAYIASERLGRTSSKEQYAYFYDQSTVELTAPGATYPEPEGTDPFHRQPFIAPFAACGGTFDAVYIVVHTDPDEATEEIDALDAVVEYSRGIYPAEQDFIVLGDLNADGSYFDEDGATTMRCEEYTWLITNDFDTTTKSTDVTYDRIIVTDGASTDYTGEAGVFRFDTAYGLNQTMTEAVSDHYPVYAVFWTGRDAD